MNAEDAAVRALPVPRVRWCGREALLLECASLAEVMALAARLRAHPFPGLIDMIPAARTVLLTFGGQADVRAAAMDLERATIGPGTPEAGATRALCGAEGVSGPGGVSQAGGAGIDHDGPGPPEVVSIDVVYDGEDLDALAALLGRSVEQVVRAHTETVWVAAFGGFAPGFTYCVPTASVSAGGALTASGASPASGPPGTSSTAPWPPIPRRDSPRTTVPAGAVALAGEFSAIYPRRSPGGWQLIGRTDSVLWDPARAERPALIRPGDRVQYRAVRPQVQMRRGPNALPDVGGAASPAKPPAPWAPPSLCVQRPGPRMLIEDRGRPGLGHLGVPRAGAADRDAAAHANRLVGNPGSAPVLEILAGGAFVEALADVILALTGAGGPVRVHLPAPDADEDAGSDDVPGDGGTAHVPAPLTVEREAPFALAAGDVLEIGPPTSGLLTYLAVRGGILAPAVLGSRARDTLSDLGPEPVVAGQELGIGPPAGLDAVAEPAPQSCPATTPAPLLIPISTGPRADWFTADLTVGTWRVSDEVDRVGLRLHPADGTDALERTPAHEGRELPSDGMVTGAIQVPPSGLPVVFGPDHPVTGGYPVIAVVERSALGRVAQLAPGALIRFTEA